MLFVVMNLPAYKRDRLNYTKISGFGQVFYPSYFFAKISLAFAFPNSTPGWLYVLMAKNSPK